MPGLRGRLGERLGGVLVGAVGGGQALAVLTQVLVPGCDDKDLFEDTGLLTVTKKAPLGGARPQT